MKALGFNQRSCTSTRALRTREAVLDAGRFTAGGSGTASTEAIANSRPRTQIVNDPGFILACTRASMITEVETSAKGHETVIGHYPRGMRDTSLSSRGIVD